MFRSFQNFRLSRLLLLKYYPSGFLYFIRSIVWVRELFSLSSPDLWLTIIFAPFLYDRHISSSPLLQHSHETNLVTLKVCQQTSPKRRNEQINLHGVITQKTIIRFFEMFHGDGRKHVAKLLRVFLLFAMKATEYSAMPWDTWQGLE